MYHPLLSALFLPRIRDIEALGTNAICTGAVLEISFDGSHFHGWSAANDPDDDDNENSAGKVRALSNPYVVKAAGPELPSRKRRGGRRNQNSKVVRSVEGVLQSNLAKLYGNIEPSRVVVCACSRLDKGVHAKRMVAHLYVPKESALDNNGSVYKSTGFPAAVRAYCEECLELPFEGDLAQMMHVLNRMLPPDVRISNIAPVPPIKTKNNDTFHATLDSITKTYEYNFAIDGPLLDPINNYRTTWHIQQKKDSSQFDLKAVEQVLRVLQGRHDFSAFKGAFRGSERNRIIKDPFCTLTHLDITIKDDVDHRPMKTAVGGSQSATIYTLTVTGDRFLYKMVRALAGVVVEVGRGTLTVDDVIFALRDGSWSKTSIQKERPTIAPAYGLILASVDYTNTGSNKDSLFDWVYNN